MNLTEVALGVRNYLVVGMSGAGKTAVAEELERRNRHVVHGDRVLAYHGDPNTGARLVVPAEAKGIEALRWRHRCWIWDMDKVQSLIEDQSRTETFFCGSSRNHARYARLFNKVFVLDVDLDTLKRRLRGRAADEFGARPEEWSTLVGLDEAKEDVPEGALRIDGALPVGRVVDEILLRCAEPSAR